MMMMNVVDFVKNLFYYNLFYYETFFHKIKNEIGKILEWKQKEKQLKRKENHYDKSSKSWASSTIGLVKLRQIFFVFFIRSQ